MFLHIHYNKHRTHTHAVLLPFIVIIVEWESFGWLRVGDMYQNKNWLTHDCGHNQIISRFEISTEICSSIWIVFRGILWIYLPKPQIEWELSMSNFDVHYLYSGTSKRIFRTNFDIYMYIYNTFIEVQQIEDENTNKRFQFSYTIKPVLIIRQSFLLTN